MRCVICSDEGLDRNEAVCTSCVERYGRAAHKRKRDQSPRNVHDTRVATAIVCCHCGKDDRLPFVPRNKSQAMCRDCAAEHLDIHLPGAKQIDEEIPDDLYERLGVTPNDKARVHNLKIKRGAKAGSVVYKRKRGAPES